MLQVCSYYVEPFYTLPVRSRVLTRHEELFSTEISRQSLGIKPMTVWLLETMFRHLVTVANAMKVLQACIYKSLNAQIDFKIT